MKLFKKNISKNVNEGSCKINKDASSVSLGIYYIILNLNDIYASEKLILIK